MSLPVRAAVGLGATALAATALAVGPASGAHALPDRSVTENAGRQAAHPVDGSGASGDATSDPTPSGDPTPGGEQTSGLVSLNVTPRVQEQSNWCWSATGSAAAQFLGKDVSQNEFCQRANGRNPSGRCPNTQGDINMIQTALDSVGLNPGRGSGNALSFPTVKKEIEGKRPMLARILWRSGGGHYLLVEGMDPQAQTVQWIDPWPENKRVSVADYRAFRSNNDFTWTHSISSIGASS